MTNAWQGVLRAGHTVKCEVSASAAPGAWHHLLGFHYVLPKVRMTAQALGGFSYAQPMTSSGLEHPLL